MPNTSAHSRDREIVRAGVTGIVVNFLLALFKVIIGIAVSSMAMVLDAVNNLSDALSSILTVIGTKLANKKPDKKHPLGYGRIEYLTGLIVAALVLYAGVTALIESVQGIITPKVPAYSVASLVFIGASIAAKLLLGHHIGGVGARVNSPSLVASATDAKLDAMLSAAVLASAVVFLLSGVNLEAWVSVALSIFIIRSGIELLRDGMDEVLGKRMDVELTRQIRRTICEDPDAQGAFDLILHSYGPERLIGSVHIEVSDKMTATQIDRMERRVSEAVLKRHNVLLTGIGIYSYDRLSDDMRDRIFQIARKHEGLLQLHGFFVDEDRKRAGFDAVLDYALENREETFHAICDDVQKAFPEYEFQIAMDIDI